MIVLAETEASINRFPFKHTCTVLPVLIPIANVTTATHNILLFWMMGYLNSDFFFRKNTCFCEC